ncbi:MAG: IclR family transcriptional regulator [Ilumatobacteraceae bacterium]|nr:IclR family transcriptional regulator [Ilumatobacteraceae bacterium]
MADESDIVIAEDGRRLRPVKSVSHAIDLLDVLAADGEPMGVTELAIASKMSKTAAYNLVTTLELRGLVRRDAQNRYSLGWRLLELGEVVRLSSTLGAVATSRVAALAESAGETALLAVLDNNTVFCVELAESRRSAAMSFTPGHRQRIEQQAAGCVLMAYSAAGRRRRYLDDTSRSDALAATLDRIKADGYAVVTDGPEPGVVSVAVPVFDYTREAVAGLSLMGPATRFTADRVRELVRLLTQESAVISRSLGSTAVHQTAVGEA